MKPRGIKLDSWFKKAKVWWEDFWIEHPFVIAILVLVLFSGIFYHFAEKYQVQPRLQYAIERVFPLPPDKR
jgi:hypothetical protein